MKTKFIYIIAALLISFQAISQINRTTETKVADILAQMPTDDLKHRDRVMAEMVTLGEKGLQLFTDGVIPPGTGDDTAVRFALNGLVRYASAFGKDEEKAITEAALIKALTKASDKEVKAFFIHQLKLVAEDNSVEVVNEYLKDERLGAPAVQLLLTVASSTAERQLMNALSSAQGENKVAIVKGLGELKSKKAYSAIAVMVGSGDSDLQRVTLYAMANIADLLLTVHLLVPPKPLDINTKAQMLLGHLPYMLID